MRDLAPVDAVISALANPTRRELVELLLDRGSLPVKELASRFEMSRPSVSEHLAVLRRAGLVTERKRGRDRLYSLNPQQFAVLSDWLRPYEEFWRDRLGSLRALLEEQADE